MGKTQLKKSNKGITLIALIITIIVLLILAGVTINAISGSDSTPAKAQEATQRTDIASAKEDCLLAATTAKTDALHATYVTQNANKTIAQAVIEELLKKNNTSIGSATIEVANDGTVTISTSSYEVIGTVDENGTLTFGEVESSVPGIKLKVASSFTMTEGETKEVEIDFKKITANDVTWTSNKQTNATVAKDPNNMKKATISALAKTTGNDKVTITISAGEYSATIEVKVIESLATIKSKSDSLNVSTTASNLENVEWSTLKKLAKAIETDISITNATKEVVVTYGGNDYILKVGATKNVFFKENNGIMITNPVRIIGFNHDIVGSLDNAKGEKGITFEFETILKQDKINNTNTNNGGWEASVIRNNLNYNYLPKLYDAESDGTQIKEYIKEVKKDYNKGYNSDSTISYTVGESTGEKIWLLSCAEIWPESSSYSNFFGGETEGTCYAYYENNPGCIKNLNGNPFGWWLRSPSKIDDKTFCYAGGSGSGWYSNASNSCGVSPGFTI